MPSLPLILAPDSIFKQKSKPVDFVNDEIKKLMDDLLATIYFEQGVGIAAPMVGKLLQVVVIDLQVEGIKEPIFMANPEIIEVSDTKQTFNEGSLCFPGIKAEITRASNIKVKYLDYNNNMQQLAADGFLAQTIQHEIDYLHGKVYLDYLSSLKRDMLLKKMQKYIKQLASHHHHQHDEFCNH
jgi:peptide deformylase